MHQLYVIIIILGVVLGSLMVAAYLWVREKLSKDTWLNCIGFGVLLGMLAVASLFNNYFIYVFIMAGYVSYFIYLKDQAEYTFLKESTMLSLILGAFIGFFGLIGCVVYHV